MIEQQIAREFPLETTLWLYVYLSLSLPYSSYLFRYLA